MNHLNRLKTEFKILGLHKCDPKLQKSQILKLLVFFTVESKVLGMTWQVWQAMPSLKFDKKFCSTLDFGFRSAFGSPLGFLLSFKANDKVYNYLLVQVFGINE